MFQWMVGGVASSHLCNFVFPEHMSEVCLGHVTKLIFIDIPGIRDFIKMWSLLAAQICHFYRTQVSLVRSRSDIYGFESLKQTLCRLN